MAGQAFAHARAWILACPAGRARLGPVVTGFNTDVKYQGVVYHVQTEDKGPQTPMILTLIYKGGEILGSHRLTYTDLLKGEDDEAQIAQMMEDQHKTVMADVKRGKYAPGGENTMVEDLSLDEIVLAYLAQRFAASK
jgi:hypothetical protein